MPSGRATTFDIFDTLITRAVGAPSSVFLLLGRLPAVATLTGVSAEEFARLRIHGERRIRRGGRDVTLAEIYREVGAGLGLAAAAAESLAEAELALERRLTRAVPDAVMLLDGAAADRRLALSDMYLPSGFVTELLTHHGFGETFEAVHVSSDTGAMKRDGAMFTHVASVADLDPAAWTHIGDDARSDHLVPRSLGITTAPVTRARLNRYEAILDGFRWETGGTTSLFSGASRSARLAAPSSPVADVIVDVAAGVAAPTLCAFVLWLLNNARSEGINRLYFLARDGELLYQVAGRLCQALGWQMDLRYLHGSRYVFHRAGLAEAELAGADWAWRSLYALTNDQVLRRLGLDDAEVLTTLARHGLNAHEVTPGIDELLIADDALATSVRSAAGEAQAVLRQYLVQEGLTDGVPFALVDTGWEGRLVQSLHDALLPLGGRVERVFFMGHLQRGKGFENPAAITGYFFDEASGSGFLEASKQLRWLVEAFCAADHGMTVGFERTADRVLPVLASASNPALARWPFWALFRQTIYAFISLGVWDADLIDTRADLRRPVDALLSALWFHPSDDEAAVWGEFPFEDDLLASTRHPLARSIGVADFATRARSGYEGRRVWIPASVRMSAPLVRPLATAGLWLKDAYDESRGEGSTPAGVARGRAAALVELLRSRASLALRGASSHGV